MSESFVLGLCLEEEFDSFDGSCEGFGSDACETSSQEVEEREVVSWFRLVDQVVGHCCWIDLFLIKLVT